MSISQSISSRKHLVVGSLRTAQDQTYLTTAQRLEKDDGKGQVEMQLWDRIIAGAAELTPQGFETSYVVLTVEDVQGWTLQQLLRPIQNALVVGGTVEVTIPGMDATSIKSEMEQSGLEVISVDGKVLAKKIAQVLPQAPSAGSVPLKLRRNGYKQAKAKLWAVSDTNVDTPLIDDESLLTEEDKMRPSLVVKPDCDVKRTRKACKNCTCGLRELELEEDDDLPATTQLQGGGGAIVADDVAKEAVKGGLRKIKVKTGAVTSSCGSCYLGDAFRCSGCPYLGLPAFEPGQKVQLTADMGDDV